MGVSIHWTGPLDHWTTGLLAILIVGILYIFIALFLIKYLQLPSSPVQWSNGKKRVSTCSNQDVFHFHTTRKENERKEKLKQQGRKNRRKQS